VSFFSLVLALVVRIRSARGYDAFLASPRGLSAHRGCYFRRQAPVAPPGRSHPTRPPALRGPTETLARHSDSRQASSGQCFAGAASNGGYIRVPAGGQPSRLGGKCDISIVGYLRPGKSPQFVHTGIQISSRIEDFRGRSRTRSRRAAENALLDARHGGLAPEDHAAPLSVSSGGPRSAKKPPTARQPPPAWGCYRLLYSMRASSTCSPANTDALSYSVEPAMGLQVARAEHAPSKVCRHDLCCGHRRRARSMKIERGRSASEETP